MLTIGSAASGAVTIDADRLISTRMLVQANSGGGKSWMLRVLCERLGRGTPLVVLDWEGEFASLREKLDVLLVGREGEIPTAVATAGALATQILEIGVSAVIDLYDLGAQDKRAYVRRFLESLMAAPKRLWGPRVVFVDEAHALAPETGDAESADAVKSLASAGRKRQFCAVLATQRLSKLHKDAAAECNNVLIGRTTLDLDQKRAGDVLGMNKAEYVKLRDLDAGEFYGYGPAFNVRGVFRLKSDTVETSHGMSVGESMVKPPAPSVRMARAIDQLKDLAERSKTEVMDLDAARSTIADLRRQLAEQARRPETPSVDVERTVAQAVQAERSRVRLAAAHAVDLVAANAAAVHDRAEKLELDSQSLMRQVTALRTLLEAAPAPVVAPVVPARAPSQGTDHAAAFKKVTLPDGISMPHMKILLALSWWRAVGDVAPERAQVAAVAGYTVSGGTFSRYLSALSSCGAIEYPANGTVSATQLGRELSGEERAPTTLEELHSRAMKIIDAPHRKILRVLLDAGGADLGRTEVAERSGYEAGGGTFSRYMSHLSSVGLIRYPRRTSVAAAAWLFPEGLR